MDKKQIKQIKNVSVKIRQQSLDINIKDYLDFEEKEIELK